MATTGVTHSPPSAQSASALVRGEPGALGMCVAHTAVRTALVAGGIYLAGMDGRTKDLWKYALGGALSIEAFLVLYAVSQERR